MINSFLPQSFVNDAYIVLLCYNILGYNMVFDIILSIFVIFVTFVTHVSCEAGCVYHIRSTTSGTYFGSPQLYYII